jgi:hypothetical protein
VTQQNLISYSIPTSQPLQPLQWQAFVGIAIDVMILVALGAWAFSQVKKAWKGEEVKLPLS